MLPALRQMETSLSVSSQINRYVTNWSYCIAGNFRERKLSRIGEKYDFRRENFRGLLTFAPPKFATLPNLAEKAFANSHKITKFASFLSRRFPATLYTVVTVAITV